MGANSGWGMKFAKVPGCMRFPGTLPKSRGASEQISDKDKNLTQDMFLLSLRICSLAPLDFGKVPGDLMRPGTLANFRPEPEFAPP